MSFGSTRGAIVSLKNNRRKRKSKLEKVRNSTGASYEGIGKGPNLSEIELLELGKRLETEHRHRFFKIITITLSLLIILSIVFYYLMF